MTVKILHNPRCSKSRATLALLQEHGIEPEIKLYLDAPPSPGELHGILKKLGMKPRQLMRKGEAEYAALALDDPGLSDDELINFMVAHDGFTLRDLYLCNSKSNNQSWP